MRVIAGTLKGRRLVAPRGTTTRPTADQVRIALMDILGPWLAGARLLDLFAGAGSVGLEALSRGAVHATFVERDPRALAALSANVRALAVESHVRLLKASVRQALTRLAQAGANYDIVFLDPPYEVDVVPDTLAQIHAARIVRPEGLVVVQHLTKRPPPAEVPGLTRFRARRFGETTLTFFRAGEYPALV